MALQHNFSFVAMRQYVFVTFLGIALSACGGGGGSSETSTNSNTSTSNPEKPTVVEAKTISGGVWTLDFDTFVGYYVTVENLMQGRITAVGNGVEGVFDGAVGGDYFYTVNSTNLTLDQYFISTNAIEKTGLSLATSALGSDRFRTIDVLADTLFLATWPNDNGNAPYALVKIPELTVETSGTFNLPDVDGFDAIEAGAIVKGNKIYVGTMYSNLPIDDNDKTGWTRFPEKLITWIYDYPSFSNPRKIETNASLGSVAGFGFPAAVLDENGDIYQANIRSKHWYNMGTRKDMPSVIVRIRDGEYDPSYVFNVSNQFSNTISLLGIQYAGNGIAFGILLDEDASDEWVDVIASNISNVVRIDMYKQQIQVLDLPKIPGGYFWGGFVEGDKYYVPIAPAGEGAEAYIYEVDVATGAVTQGAQIDAGTARVVGLFDHTK